MPLRTIPINDLDDPRLLPYRNQRDAWLKAPHNPARAAPTPPDAQPLFMAEGVLVIAALLASRFQVDSVLATPTRLGAIEADLLARAPDVPVYLAPPSLLEQIVGFDLHRGLLAAARRAPPLSPADLITTSRVLVLAENLSNHDNVGGMFRSLAALIGPGAGVLLSPGCCDPLYRKALRVSMGHALRVPFAMLDPWPQGLARVAKAGFRTLALTPAGAASSRRLDLKPDQRVALLIGAEGPGLAPDTLNALSGTLEPVAIPMAPGVDSLNVVVALSLALDRVAERVGPGPAWPPSIPRTAAGSGG